MPQTGYYKTNRAGVIMLVGLMLVLLVPWLGQTLFSSKGEPREAIVAVSILESGNWVLPVSYGADIPYKPPFLAWIIAVFSIVFNGGTVNEFCCRLPSALALTAMTSGFYLWLRRRTGENTAISSALVLATSFEVFRSAVICRVDMLLTACIVLSLLLMHSWRERGKWWKLPLAVLLLSGAVLTKGPVGALLPCLAMGIYCLVRGDNFFVTVGWLTAVCVASMILPAIWYVAAYRQGGEHFYNLAYEENIGRLTGSMGYESHVNPWWYNLLTLLYGMLPWTLVALLGACVLKWKRPRFTDVGIFSLTVALTVLMFYCIPASKRSVYLLPMYPFMAYGIAALLESMRRKRALEVYGRIWLRVVIIAPVVAVAAIWMPLGKLTLLHPEWWQWPLAAVAPVLGIYLVKARVEAPKALIISTVSLFFFYLSVYQPLVLNPKSDRAVAEEIRPLVEAKVPVYSLIEDSLMRYYTVNYYLDDHLRRLETVSAHGLKLPFAVLVQEQMLPQLSGYVAADCDTMMLTRRSCDNRRGIILCKFEK